MAYQFAVKTANKRFARAAKRRSLTASNELPFPIGATTHPRMDRVGFPCDYVLDKQDWRGDERRCVLIFGNGSRSLVCECLFWIASKTFYG